MLAAVIRGPTYDAALAEMEKAAPLADLFELRLDHFEEAALSRLNEIVAKAALPLIFTFRKQEQGGARPISEGERLKKFEDLLALSPAYADIEADTESAFIERIGTKFPGIALIGSYHNFNGMPEDLSGVLRRMQHPYFSIYKIAALAHSTIDLLRMMMFAQEHSETTHLSCIAMGEAGQPSRVLGPVVGGAIDYASLEEEQGALFQYSLRTLHERFGYRRLNRETELFALLGNPVVRSPGDVFHNERFIKEGRNALYVKLRLDREEIGAFFSLFRRLPFRGFSVTIPLKEAMIDFLNQIDSSVKQIGAVNTVTMIGSLTFGSNTDAPGALNAIEKHLKVKGKKVAILGAGGTARAIAYEARRRGAEVEVFNRSADKMSDLGVAVYPLRDIGHHSYDFLINTIPPLKETVFEVQSIPSSAIVMDVNYHPRETPLLKAARERGCACIYGEEMFVEQALLQQLAWKE